MSRGQSINSFILTLLEEACPAPDPALSATDELERVAGTLASKEARSELAAALRAVAARIQKRLDETPED